MRLGRSFILGHDHATLVTFARRVVVEAELLSDEVNGPSFYRAQRLGEGEFVAHAIILEEQDPRVDFEGAGLVEVEFFPLARATRTAYARYIRWG